MSSTMKQFSLSESTRDVWCAGDLLIDVASRAVLRNYHEKLDISGLSFDLLVSLVRASPSYLNQDELIEAVWDGRVVSPETVVQRVKLLRKSLGDDAKNSHYIHSARGHGYKFLPEVHRVENVDSETSANRESTRDYAKSQPVARNPGRKAYFTAVALLSTALIYFAYDKFFLIPSGNIAATGANNPTVYSESAEPTAQPADTRNSIAVLPFINLSDDPGNEYFSDGMSEELTNLLTQIPQLRVIARTSSFAFKGKQASIAEIARELRVDYVLEGSVRKAGDQVRIAAQLIRTDDSSHLWSADYDRTLDNIFAVQEEIASEVVEHLEVALLGSTPTVRKTDPEAYALFLQARYFRNQGTPEAWQQAVPLYEKVLAIDPDYATAWVQLADVKAIQRATGLIPSEEGLSRREVVEQALAVDPASLSAHTALAVDAMEKGDFLRAARYFRNALELAPTDPSTLGRASSLLTVLGRRTERIAIMKYVLSVDPVNAAGHAVLGTEYLADGQLENAIASLRTALRLSPGQFVAQLGLAGALRQRGDFEAALEAAQAIPTEGFRLCAEAHIFHAMGRKAESDAVLAELIAKYDQQMMLQIASLLAYRGEADQAFEWLERAVKSGDPSVSRFVAAFEFPELHDDPRWLPLLERLGISPAQLAEIKFDMKVPG